MSDSTEQGPVWAVCRRDRSHRVLFPARDNAERWRQARDDIWDIVPVDDDETALNDRQHG